MDTKQAIARATYPDPCERCHEAPADLVLDDGREVCAACALKAGAA